MTRTFEYSGGRKSTTFEMACALAPMNLTCVVYSDPLRRPPFGMPSTLRMWWSQTGRLAGSLTIFHTFSGGASMSTET